MSNKVPNIVFVFADDWGWGDLGCYGHQRLKTPNIDALASQGTLFTQFYVCSGVCSPSRAAVLSGRFPGSVGLHAHFHTHEHNSSHGMPDFLDPGIASVPRLLQERGYKTGHFGKWHLGHTEDAPEPVAYGYDESKVNIGNGPQLDFGGDNGWSFVKGQRHRSSEVIIDETIDFIRRNNKEPFFVNVWLNDTHGTLDPDEKQLEPYRHLFPQDVKEKHVGTQAIYYAAATNADYHVGRLMNYLDEANLSENTVLIFSADNGPEDILINNVSHSGIGSPGPFRGRKRSLYEGGVRTPFVIRWPGGDVPAGIINNDTALCSVDLLPTFCDLAGKGAPTDIGLDGEIMSDVFKGSNRERSKSLHWEWRFQVAGHPINKSPILSIRQGVWKLLFNQSGDRTELYHIPNDPMELNNLAGANPKIVDELAAKANVWQSSLPQGPVHPKAGSNDYPWPGTF